MNRPMTQTEIKSIKTNKNFLQTKVQDQMASQVNSAAKHAKKNLYQFFSLFQRLKRDHSRDILRSHHHPDNKSPPRKENYRPVSLTNIDAKTHLKRQNIYTQKTLRHSGKKSRMTQADGETHHAVELEESILQK